MLWNNNNIKKCLINYDMNPYRTTDCLFDCLIKLLNINNKNNVVHEILILKFV